MNTRSRGRWAGLIVVLAMSGPFAAYGGDAPREVPVSAADMVLRGGEIYTLNSVAPWAQAVAVSGTRIVYVGSNAGVRRFVGPATRVVELGGKTLLPGLIDSHLHPAMGEYLNHRFCNVHSYTLEEGYAKLATCASRAPPGDWVVAYGWYYSDNPHLSEVTLAKLDALVPERKLVVIARDFHTFWLNSASLRHFGIDRATPNPAGGSYEHDPGTGQPSGVLHDGAEDAVYAAIQHESPYAATSEDLYGTAVPYLNSLGITSMLDALVTDDSEAAYHALDAKGRLSMRVSLAFPVTAANFRTEIPRIAAKRSHQSPHTRVDFVKVFADGNAEDHLANLLGEDGRSGPSSHGYYTQQQMDELVRLAEQNGLSVFVHVIGDGAARQVLDAIARARAVSPCPGCRHTLTHMQWVAPADRARFRQLGVLANIQEGWLSPLAIGGAPGYDYVVDTARGPLGAHRARSMYPFRQLHQAGARLSASSDWFFTEENPWNTIESGITSRDPGIANQRPMLPGSTLDRATLIRARTLGAAYQMYNEAVVGSVEVGKEADLVVLDRNVVKVPVDRIHDTHVLQTFFAGRELPAPGASAAPRQP